MLFVVCRWVDASIKEGILTRDENWTESVAVGSEPFVRGIKNKLGFRAKGRRVIGGDGSFSLRESRSSYKGNFGDKNAVIGPKNVYFWKRI